MFAAVRDYPALIRLAQGPGGKLPAHDVRDRRLDMTAGRHHLSTRRAIDGDVSENRRSRGGAESRASLGTERPVTGALVSNTRSGLSIDIVSGEPSFASLNNHVSNRGRQSFTNPIAAAGVIKMGDAALEVVRMQATHGDSHPGHVFDDRPGDQIRPLLHQLGVPAVIPRQGIEMRGDDVYQPQMKEIG